MSGGQSLTDGSVADSMAETRREISIAEFFEKNKQMLGFDSGARSLVTTVKEGVDNALDATEEARILPEISVEVTEEGSYYGVAMEDNGPGITKEQVPKVFGKLLYGSRFGKRRQARGQQGIGISAAVLYSQLTSGKPARITSKTSDSDTAEYFELIIDTDSNEPEIRTHSEVDWDKDHGTRIELEMEANMRSRSQLHEYIKYTAVVNPHATIKFDEPGINGGMEFERQTDELPAETEEIKPHPHGVELGTLMKMLDATRSHSLSGFLKNEFTKVGAKSADSIIDGFRDREYGRELALDPSGESGRYKDAVVVSVNRKDPDATEAFGNAVADSIGSDALTYTDVEGLVHGAADTIEDDYDERLGDTVRENAVKSVWAELENTPEPTFQRLADDATSSHKDADSVSSFATRLAQGIIGDNPDRGRINHGELVEYVERAANLTDDVDGVTFGDTAQENVVNEVWSEMKTVSEDVPKIRTVSQDRDLAGKLLESMQKANIHSPSADCLSPIGEDNIRAGLKTVFDGAEFYASSTRSSSVYKGDPFIVEAGLAYGGDLSQQDNAQAELLRFANRVPLVYSRGGCAITNQIKGLRWRTYNFTQPSNSGIPKEPAVIMIHVASTNVPFNNESKDSVASVPPIEEEITRALRDVGKEIRSHLKEQRRLNERREKKNVLGRILPQMAEKSANILGEATPNVAETEARIMNNVYVGGHTTDTTVTVRVTNYNNSGSETLEIVDEVDGEVTDPPEDAEVTTNGDTTKVVWNVTVSSGEEATIEYGSESGGTLERTVNNIEMEKVTIDE